MTEIPRNDEAGEALSYTPLGNRDFQKLAHDKDLSQDIRDWPAQILQEFASQHPYAFQASAPEIEFEKVDEKTGSAFGAIILRKPYQVNGLGGPQERLDREPEKCAVPIVIESFKLKGFEVFIHGEKVLPLTENRYAEAVGSQAVANGLDPYFQPSPMFMDKMLPPTVGYLGNLYGNYSLSGGEGDYSSWTPGKGAQEIFEPKLEKKSGSADPSKDELFVNSLRATIQQGEWDGFRKCLANERITAGFAANKTLNIVRDILGTKPTCYDDYLDFIEKSAPVHLVCLCRKSNGRWYVTETNDYFYKPVVKEMTSEQVVKKYSEMEPRVASLIQENDEVLLESSARKHVRPIVLEDHEVVSEEITTNGHYLVVTKDGGIFEGQVFNRVMGYNGNAFDAKLFLSGSAFALQECMVGERRGDVLESLKDGSVEVGVEGTFVGGDEQGEFALLPFKVTNVGYIHSYLVVQGRGMSDETLTFIMMPGVTKFINMTGIADPLLGDKVAGNVFYVPPGFHFMALGKKIRLSTDPREVKQLLGRKVFFSDRHLEPFTVETTRKGHCRSLRLISGPDGTFTMKGSILETMHRDAELQDVPPGEARWILSVFGVPLNETARLTAMAISRGEVNVANLRPVKDMVKKEQIFDQNVADLAAVFRRNLAKEASTMSDPKAVDAMLSLNFVNESNLIEFLQNLPLFKEVEQKMAELYLYTTLGLKNRVPENAVLSAMKSLNEVVEHLEYLMAMMQAPASQNQTTAA